MSRMKLHAGLRHSLRTTSTSRGELQEAGCGGVYIRDMM